MDRSKVIPSHANVTLFCLVSILLSCGTDYNVVAVIDEGGAGGTIRVNRLPQGDISGGNTQGSNVDGKAGHASEGGAVSAGGVPSARTTVTKNAQASGGSPIHPSGGASYSSYGGSDSSSYAADTTTINRTINSPIIWNVDNSPSNDLCFCTPPGAPPLCDEQGEITYPDCSESCLTRFPECIGSCSCDEPLFGDVILGESIACATHSECPSGSVCLVALDTATLEPVVARCL